MLIVDVNMPEIDGLSLCAHLLAPDRRSIDVVVMTGNANPETIERCDSYGATYARKASDLWDKVRDALTESFPDIAAQAAARERPGRGQVSQRPRVLVIDDDPDVGSFLCSRLLKCGVDALYASDGMAGFRMARDDRPIAIISDYYMPNGDAAYLLWKLRTLPATDAIPVFIMSGRRLDDATKANLQREFFGRPGAARVFRKPLEFEEIVLALQKFCTLDIARSGGTLATGP
jgi:CheY-like chemotaxis protein